MFRTQILHLCEGAFEMTADLVPASVGYRWFLDDCVPGHPMTVIFSEGGFGFYEEFKAKSEGTDGEFHNYVYLGTTSLYPNTAPPGKQLVYAVMSCYPNPDIDVRTHLAYVCISCRP
ncbi:MAG: hypothetical protein LKE40_05285 [Spirochaetia bacterium]|jgi:hypothetical protein|nr:hypothetical protein [Spirochaetia bacterium]